MNTNFQIARRFITARKRAMFMSLAGIAFGVAFFILTQAQTAGFQSFFIQTILGVNGMVRIEDRIQGGQKSSTQDSETGAILEADRATKYIPGVQFPARVISALQQFPEVVSASPVIRGNAVLKANFRDYDAKPYGIELDSYTSVSDLAGQIIQGSLQDFAANPYGVIVGIRIAQRMGLKIGDSILLESVHARQRYRIAGFFETGIDMVDRERVYIHLSASRVLLDQPSGASFIQINLTDANSAPYMAGRIRTVVSHYTLAWQDREKTWLQVFSVLRLSSAITISSIILISGLGMFNTLVMIIVDKTREIAILRSMGFTRSDIVSIFMQLGAFVLIAGVLSGWTIAAAATYGLSRLPIRIRGIFATDHFVVQWDIMHYVWAGVIATIVVLIASYFPARRAARLEPGAVIRGSSS